MTASLCFFAAIVELALAPGSAEKPSAVFPLKPGERPRAFAWTEAGLSVDGRTVAWAELGVTPKDGAEFVYRTVCADGEPGEVRGTLRAEASSFAVAGFDRTGDCDASGTVSVTARRAGKADLTVFVQGPRSPILRQFKNAVLKAGETKTMNVVGRTSTVARFTFHLKDVGGTTLFRALDWSVRQKDLVFALRCLRTDREKMVLYVRSDNWFGTDLDHRLRVDMLDYDSGHKVWSKTVPAQPRHGRGYHADDGRSEQPVDVRDLPPGQYKCVVTLLDASGAEGPCDYLFYAKPDGPAVWEGTSFGNEDTVPPPWTPPNFADGSFSCWNRIVRFGGPGLVGSVFSAGKELLKEPVAVVLDGRKLSFASRLVTRGASFGEYELVSDDPRVSVRCRAEFDGFMNFSLTWKPPVKSLELVTRMRRDVVLGFDDCSDGIRKLALPCGTATSFDYDCNLKQFWWMGSQVGLLGGFDDLRGRRLKDTAKGYRLEVDDDAATLVSRLVDTPADDGGARTLSFYLEATPTRPKNAKMAMLPPERIDFWTGHVEKHFEDKWPGHVRMEKLAPFRERVRKGERIFYYNSSCGASPSFPWWGWFGDDWTIFDDPEPYCEEIPFADRKTKDADSWLCCCVGSKGFFDYKLWSVCWYFWTPEHEIRDLYWDLAVPYGCMNPRHAWKDEFGVSRSHRPETALRELHLRAYRELKKHDPDGMMLAHVARSRLPSDAFFDAVAMGELLDVDVCRAGFTYYDVLTPVGVQLGFASRANEQTVVMGPQIIRGLQMYAADKLAGYDCHAPENDRAIRHATAYFKIHDLNIAKYNTCSTRWLEPDRLLAREFGEDRRHSAYYTGTCPVRVDRPEDRFLYALYEGNGRKLLVLVNDTDRAVEKRVSIDGYSGAGEDIFLKERVDLSEDGATFSLGPRESRFVYFR